MQLIDFAHSYKPSIYLVFDEYLHEIDAFNIETKDVLGEPNYLEFDASNFVVDKIGISINSSVKFECYPHAHYYRVENIKPAGNGFVTARCIGISL